MYRKLTLSGLLTLFLCLNVSALEWGISTGQWTRFEKSANTFILAPGLELSGSLYVREDLEFSVSILAGRKMGTFLGGSINGKFYLTPIKQKPWRMGVGLGFTGGYVDQIFMATTSSDYIVPYNTAIGFQVNLAPFYFKKDWGYFSLCQFSFGTDVSAPFRKNFLDIGFLSFTFNL